MKYRYKALNKQRQPDQLDSAMVLATPGGWVAVFVVLIVAVFIGLWGFLGSIPEVAKAHGVLGYPGGVVPVQAPAGGTLSELRVKAGKFVRFDEVIGSMRAENGASTTIRASQAGRIVSITGTLGAVVSRGEPIAEVEIGYDANASLGVDLLVDSAVMPRVQVGQRVLLTVPGVNSRSYGLLKGRISAIEPFPVSGDEASTVRGEGQAGMAPADRGAGGSAASTASLVPPTRVHVLLEKSDSTYSGYAWTSSDGPRTLLTSRTPVAAEIELGSSTPLGTLLGG